MSRACWEGEVPADLLRAVLEGTSDAIYIKDLEGRYRLINPAGARFLGSEPDQVVGRRDSEFFAEETLRKLRQEDAQVIATGEVVTYEEFATSKAGGCCAFYATKGPYRDRDGRIVGTVGIARDITERKAIERENAKILEELREAERRAREATEIRDEFLSIASHELKTPITTLTLGIQSLLRLAERGELASYPAERLKLLLGIASDQSLRLSRLVDELLDTSRISAGRLAIQPMQTDLSELVEKVVLLLSEPIRAAECRVETRIERGIEGRFDRSRIEQVLTNLLTNALKYGPGKPIIVCLRRDSGTARLSVQDFGIGIAPENQEKIFSRFERAVSSRHFGGLGLGLYIVREILKSHGGEISVESKPGKGSTFTVVLPLQELPCRTREGIAARGLGPPQ